MAAGIETFFRNISPDDIAGFDHRNHTDPYPQPPRNMEFRQQLQHRRRYKNEVGDRVQPTSEPAGTVCFSGDGTVDHITETAEEICDIKCRGKCGKEQQQNATENTTGSEYICNMLRHLFAI